MSGAKVDPTNNASVSASLRVAAPGRLRSLLLDGAHPVLLLGAGASIKSGIPAAGATVERVARWAWCKDNGRHPEDFTIRRSDYWPWLTALPWFKQDLPLADLYPDAIDSPGGLIEQIVAQVGGQIFQQAIADRTAPIKGYRNPAISDLFYGGGQMDRRGSGLSDMVRLTANNNGAVSFGPSPDNSSFLVTMAARPEAVDEITNTALPVAEETVRYTSNLIPFAVIPETVWHAGTGATSNRSFYRSAEELAVPSGHVSDGRFYSLYNLSALTDEMVSPFDPGDIETLAFLDLLDLPGGEPVALKLLHDLIFDHLKARGLLIEYDRRRAYYGKGGAPELKISYQGRLRKATRTVVKARTKRDSDDVAYYEHEAFSFSVMRFAEDWAVVITPGYAFTRDGERKSIGRERTNALSTRRAARDFNPSVLQDVSFWLAIISGGAEGLFALDHAPANDLARFAPTVLLKPQPPTISFNVAAFKIPDHDAEIDEDLRQLDAELEALALKPPAEEDADDIDPEDDSGGDPDEGGTNVD